MRVITDIKKSPDYPYKIIGFPKIHFEAETRADEMELRKIYSTYVGGKTIHVEGLPEFSIEGGIKTLTLVLKEKH